MSKPKNVSKEIKNLYKINAENLMLYGWVQGCKDLCRILGVENVTAETMIKRFCDVNNIDDFDCLRTQYYITQKRLIKGDDTERN